MIKKFRFTPTLKVTRYDIISSALLSLLIMFVLANMILAIIWLANRNVVAATLASDVSVEPLRVPTVQAGNDSPLLIVSPDPEIDDPSVVDTQSAEAQLQTQVDQLATVATSSLPVAEKIEAKDTTTTGKPGSQVGNDTKGLGLRYQTATGAERRWLLQFEKQSLTEYARQLDYFQIELGALTPDGKLVYLSNVSQKEPKVRTTHSGKDEKRPYFMNQGLERGAAIALFRKADVDARKAMIVYFLPKKTQDQMEQVELAKNNRPAKEIRRTYFRIKATKTGYEFEVTRQLTTPGRTNTAPRTQTERRVMAGCGPRSQQLQKLALHRRVLSR